MHRPPRPPAESVLGDGLWQRVFRMSLVIGGVTLALGRWGMASGDAWQSMVFVAMVSLQLGVAMGLRSKLWTRENPFLPLAALASLMLVLAGLYVPALRDLLGTTALPPAEALISIAVGAIGWLAIRLDLLIGQRRRAANAG
jgi:Ca2+-transporting ATPase